MAIFGSERAGKGSRISCNGVNMAQAEWTADDKADRLDTTNFESGGVFQGTIGIESVDYTCNGYWNAHQNAFDNPPGIFPQDNFPILKLFENVSDVVFWNLILAIIDSAKNGAQVRGLVSFGWSGCNNGPFVRPTGSI